MSLAQQLLMRALVAWFWREPRHGNLVRWGTALHDRFMLPEFIMADFLEVLSELKRGGLPASTPHGSRRSANSAFRSTARSSVQGLRLELRQALEPWPVLGEESVGREHGEARRFLRRAPAGEAHRA